MVGLVVTVAVDPGAVAHGVRAVPGARVVRVDPTAARGVRADRMAPAARGVQVVAAVPMAAATPFHTAAVTLWPPAVQL